MFTVAYFGISFVMFNHFVLGDIDLGEFEISFISTIFGAMSAKVNTIVDFFLEVVPRKMIQRKSNQLTRYMTKDEIKVFYKRNLAT